MKPTTNSKLPASNAFMPAIQGTRLIGMPIDSTFLTRALLALYFWTGVTLIVELTVSVER